MNIICEVCNKEFEPKNYWQKFCSKKCKILAWARRELRKIKKLIVVIMVLGMASSAFAYTNAQIADAIFKAEGGMKAEYWYGIRSVNYDDLADARQICLNTIRNQRVRHANHDCGYEYLECLGNRYAPTEGVKTLREKQLNKYWLGNVKYFLEKRK